MKHYLKFIFILSSLFFLSGAANANNSPKEGLEAYVACSDTPSYIKRWATTKRATPQRIRTVTTFAPGEIAFTAVIVTGYTIGKDKKIDVKSDFEFIKPDGSIMFSQKNYSKAKSSNQENVSFIMLDPALDIGFDHTDPTGTYKLVFKVTDNLSGKTTTASKHIILTNDKYSEKILDEPITNAKVLDDLWGYYRSSKDKRAVQKIISILHWKKVGHGQQKILGMTAEWSLTRNSFNSTAVYKICKNYSLHGESKNKKYVNAILTKVDTEKKRRSSKKDHQ